MDTVTHESMVQVETGMQHVSGKEQTPAAALSEQEIMPGSWGKVRALLVQLPLGDSFETMWG